jgi:cytidine deaminase
MSTLQKNVSINKVSYSELVADEQDLLKKALEVRKNAQAPYSNYFVGAAVLSENGQMHVGCNVERCTYSQTTHAEQNAIDTMVANEGSVKIAKVAVVAAPKTVAINSLEVPEDISGYVCGHCLQIIWENCKGDPSVKIMVLDKDGLVACAAINDLLPFRFGPESF